MLRRNLSPPYPAGVDVQPGLVPFFTPRGGMPWTYPPAQVAGTSAPPSSATRAPNRSSAGCEEILPATSASPRRKEDERATSSGGTKEKTAWAKAASAAEFK